jgi:RimJ/RimL family protein N-acetyltransferase
VGKDFTVEGSRALMDKGFRDHDMQPVYAHTITVKVASRRVMEKSRLRLIRTFWQPWPDKMPGPDEGDVEYALLRSKWEQGSD